MTTTQNTKTTSELFALAGFNKPTTPALSEEAKARRAAARAAIAAAHPTQELIARPTAEQYRMAGR